MKKIERLRFVENRFGEEFVLPYKICYDEEQITKAIREFESEGSTWGMRTDLSYGKNQGNLLPFGTKGSLSEALKVFEKYKKELVYIISHNILDYACNGVATPCNDEEVFF